MTGDFWEEVLPGVELLRDSCNVYAVTGTAGTLFVNAGSGRWLDQIPLRFTRPHAMLCTHYFRDHAAGAAVAGAQMDVYVPAGDVDVFRDPAEHFRGLPTEFVYENGWEHFAPIEPTDALPLDDYERKTLVGIPVTVLPLPGVTPHHSGYALDSPQSGHEIVFCGEAIHSPGRIARVAPLQYDYNDLGGAVNAFVSVRELRARAARMLLPSVGTPILSGADAALAQLEESLVALCDGRPDESRLIASLGEERLTPVTDHVWMGAEGEAVTWFVLSDSGKALAIDYGYRAGFGAWGRPLDSKHWQWPLRGSRPRRRPLLHSVEELSRRTGVDTVDVVLVSHYHDDHVAGIPLLQRKYGTGCWAPEHFADLLEQPHAHRFPCAWPYPIAVDRRLEAGREVAWEEHTFHVEPMSGHTRFSALIGFEVDGRRFAHTGDQWFFRDRVGVEPEDDWSKAPLLQNHVYRNGLALDGFAESATWLEQWRPDIVLSGHQAPMHTDETFFARLREWGGTFADLHERAIALGAQDAHFGPDGWGGWIWPYRIHLPDGGEAQLRATVRNPLPRQARLEVRLCGPQGWPSDESFVEAPPRAEVSCVLTVSPPTRCRRQPIAVELLIDGRSFGQVAEALVTAQEPAF